MNTLGQIIYHLRRFEGLYISRKLERYILEELAEDLFPYGVGDGDERDMYCAVKDLIANANCGAINICGTIEERTAERYECLKDAYLDLLAERNRESGQRYDCDTRCDCF
jgi:hypothetical protein